MSVFIKGMDAPICCLECFLHIRYEMHQKGEDGWEMRKFIFNCSRKPEEIEDGWIDFHEAGSGKQPWCPFVDVPTPHGRLIDEDKISIEEDVYNMSYKIISPTVIESEE